jgi:ubiquinone/menaquinone biosynthesis C-methylase UbiE
MPSNTICKKSQCHYNNTSSVYHDSWFYQSGSPYEKWQLALILNSCQRNLLSKNAAVADIGGGTGRFAFLIHEDSGLKQDVLCVDASLDMLSLAEKRNGVKTVHQDCTHFATDAPNDSFDVFLLKEVIHHVPAEHINSVYANLHRALKPDGLCLTITRPTTGIDYPLFDAAKDLWHKAQPDAQVYKAAMLAAGFRRVSVREHAFPVRMPQSAWLGAIASRVWSTFSRDNFSDEELARGIAEVAARHPADERGDIGFDERLLFVEGSKG